jgi:hypothetical protein
MSEYDKRSFSRQSAKQESSDDLVPAKLEKGTDANVDLSKIASLPGFSGFKDASLLVDKGAKAKQMDKKVFISNLQQLVDTKVNTLLKYAGFNTKDCPWLEAFFIELSTYPASEIEKILRSYLGQNIQDATTLFKGLEGKVEGVVINWVKTRKVEGIPDILQEQMNKLNPTGGGGDHFNPLAQANQPTSFPPELKKQLEHYLGASLSSIRLHSGSEAEKMLRDKDARALTVGQDIYLDLSKYSLKNPEGMGILAHEIMHAYQQMGATSIDIGNNSDAQEQDANRSLLPLLKRWSQWGKKAALQASVRPQMKTKLGVARCSTDKETNVKMSDFIEPNIIKPNEKGNLSDTLVSKYFKDRGTVIRGAYHAYGEYNPLTGEHIVRLGNIPRAVALRYYGDYIYKDIAEENRWKKLSKEDNVLFEKNMSEVLNAIGQWNMSYNIGKKFIASSHDPITDKKSIHNVILNPFAYRRGNKMRQRMNLSKEVKHKDMKNIDKENDKQGVNVEYVLKYSHSKGEQLKKKDRIHLDGNFNHILTSYTVLTNKKTNSNKVTIMQQAIINNVTLDVTSSVATQGTKSFTPLQDENNIKDDILWATVSHFKYQLQANRNNDANIPMVGKLKTYLSFLPPSKATKVKTNEMKKMLSDGAELASGALVVEGLIILSPELASALGLGILTTGGAGAVVAVISALVFALGAYANHSMSDEIVPNDIILYASKGYINKIHEQQKKDKE